MEKRYTPSPWKKKEPWQMTKAEIKNWEFDVPAGGASKTPKTVLNWRKDEYETLYDLSQQDDTFRLNEVLGKGWTDWRPMLSLIPAIKANEPITVYRVSEEGDIIPGAYVSESLEYVKQHKSNIMGGKGRIYSSQVKPSELMTYGDPHEFIYIPETIESYHKPIVKKALSEGKPVPPEVLRDYPEL